MALTPWSHDNPFTPGTLIRADEMNAALQGISASLDEFATDLTNYVVRLPDNFTGDTQIPDQTVTERLLYIDENGNFSLYAMTQFDTDVAETRTNAQLAEQYKNTASEQATLAQEAAASIEAADYSWSSLTGKPSTYPPSEHTHSITEVSGLAEALGGQSVKSIYSNGDQTVTRLGKMTEVYSASTANITKTLDMATFSIGDIVRIHKTQQDGDLAIATNAGAIQIPNASQALNHVLKSGDAAVINLFKISSTLWALTLN